jgi:putative (di)nucleoside polyphosphate hydrolase
MIDVVNLPYRDNVASVVFKGNKFLLVQLKGWPENFWKFPQGGMNVGEQEEGAVLRELSEELGTTNFKIIGKSVYTNKYDWPIDSIEKAGFRWKGQFQRFFVVEFLGDESEVNFDRNEIQACKWVKKDEIFGHIDHDHKLFVNYKNTIEKVLSEFEKCFTPHECEG